MPPDRWSRRVATEWDARLPRMLAASAAGHVLAVAALVLLAGASRPRPLPLTAYTVEITDPSALGGRLPPGAPGADLKGGSSQPPAPEPKGEPAAKAEAPVPEPKAPEPKPAEPVAKVEEPVRIPEKPKPVEPKPEAKKPEPPKPAKPEPAKPEPKATAKPAAKPEPQKAEAQKVEPPKAAAKAGTPSGHEQAPERDAYATMAERWKTQQKGGGLGGAENGSGPVGVGGDGKGGGGQLVGVEFLAYRQQVINTIHAAWTNVILRPGLVAAVRFSISPDGEVSDAQLAQSSGNPAYDSSALRAVQHVTRLPPPPSRYAKEFGEFQIEFHSEEQGGQTPG
jgi:colicin import membrane protein